MTPEPLKIGTVPEDEIVEKSVKEC